MLRKFFIVLSVCLFSSTMVCAQSYDSYNLKMAIEAMGDEDYETAFNYIEKEVKENPSNGYAWIWSAIFKQSFVQ